MLYIDTIRLTPTETNISILPNIICKMNLKPYEEVEICSIFEGFFNILLVTRDIMGIIKFNK